MTNEERQRIERLTPKRQISTSELNRIRRKYSERVSVQDLALSHHLSPASIKALCRDVAREPLPTRRQSPRGLDRPMD